LRAEQFPFPVALRFHSVATRSSNLEEAIMDSRKFFTRTALVAIALPLVACHSYLEVTDTQTGKSYYTRDVDHEDGRLRFKDEATGARVNLGNSEVHEVTREQYRNATGR
jgi:hypothetical protein